MNFFRILRGCASLAAAVGLISTAVAQVNPLAESKRFIRVPGNPTPWQSFVIPLESQKGIQLDPMGDNSAKFGNATGGALPWFMRIAKEQRFHLVTNGVGAGAAYTEAFENPLVTFGAEAGGTPLYTNQFYQFGIYGGSRAEGTSLETTNPANAFYYDAYLYVYSKSAFASGATNVVPVTLLRIRFPRRGTADWANYISNGYQIDTGAIPALSNSEISLKLVEDMNPATNSGETWGSGGFFSPIILSIKCANPDICFVYEQLGLFEKSPGSWFPTIAVLSGTTVTPKLNRLFTMDFVSRPSWRSTFIHQPHFSGEAMPPAYQGKSRKELLATSVPVTKQLGTAAAAYSTIDGSPELRRHPILDKLVADLGNDPVAISNLVLNEIGITDALAYNDNGDVSEASINSGGVNRGALATYLEGQGSPVEQCSLLVYMLRQAGYPSVYVFPHHNGLKMLDARMSALLRMQFKGLQNHLGQTQIPEIIPVNYPWVAVNVPDPTPTEPNRKKWVHLFPWLKDTEVKEGKNLYDYMPLGFRSGQQWINKYLNRDSSIFSLSPDEDTVSSLFPKFITAKLNESNPTLSIADIGVQVRDRKNYYSKLEEFPQPWSVSETDGPMVVRDNLNSMTNIFDMVNVEIWSDRNGDGAWNSGEPRVQTGDMRSLDIHNRRMLISFTRTSGDNHTMKLSMTPYRPGTTGTGAFRTSDPTWLKKQEATAALGTNDYNLKVKVAYSRQRALPTAFDPGKRWDNPFGFTSYSFGTRKLESISDLSKGDWAALCFSFGRVSQKMVEVHAQEFWAEEKRLKQTSGSTGDADIFQGSTANIMGMSYFEKTFRSQQQIKDLHKVNILSTFSSGLAKIGARRATTGKLINNGEIDLVYPVVDMSFNWLAYAGNGSLRPDQPVPATGSMDDFVAVAVADISAGEHESINTYFKQRAAVSTVKLFHLAKAEGKDLLQLTSTDYIAKGDVNYTSNGTTKKLKDWLGTSTWAQISGGFASTNVWGEYQRVMITPGPIAMSGGSYQGMAAFVVSPTGCSALITPNINGGFGYPAADYSFTQTNYTNISLSLGSNFSPSISYSPPAGLMSILAPSSYSSWNVPTVSSWGNSGYYAADSYTTSWLSQSSSSLTGSSSWSGSSYSSQYSSALSYSFNSGYMGSTSLMSDFVEMVSDPVNALTGEFYVDNVDLSLPGPLPLEIRRNYTSHNLAQSQFGYGWKFTYVPYLVMAQSDAVIYAAEADGSVIAYRRTTSTSQEWVPKTEDNPRLHNIGGDGMGAKANLLNAKIVRTTPSGSVLFTLTGADGSKRTFRTRSFPVDSSNQRERPYLDKWEDTNGNRLTFSFYDDAFYGSNPKGPEYGELRRIESTNGNFVGFNYDATGRVVEAYTRDGRRLTYQYDQYGDLVRVNRPDATVISYEYKHETTLVSGKNETISQHLIERELKPEGRVLKNVYDSKRRVTEQWATVGPDMNPVKNAEFAYTHTSVDDAPLTGNTLVTAWHNGTSSYVTRYDYSDGMITKITDPLLQEETQIWYLPGDTTPGAYPRSLKRLVDRRGLITDFKYDARGNLSEKKVTGMLTGNPAATNEMAVTSYVFNTSDLPKEILSPGGHKTVINYEDNVRPRQPTTIERWEGVSGPGTGTKIATGKNVYYNVISGSVGAYGLLQQQTRAFSSSDASVVTFTHSADGFLTSRSQATGTTDPAVVTSYRYNLRGEVIEEKDAIGRRTSYSYDDMGRRTAVERRNEGNALIWWNFDYFNSNGELEWSDGPRYNPEDYVYRKHDGGGRVSEEIRWRSKGKVDGTGVEAPVGDNLHATTFFKNDYFGNVTETSDARRNASKMQYDGLGQLVGQQSYEGATTSTLLSSEAFQYEPGGEVKLHVNPLAGQTKKFYTSTGKIRRQENPDGSVLEWLYYLDGRPYREVLRNGSYWENTYNDLSSKVTRTFRNSGGTALGTEETTFDLRGNAIVSKDLEDHVFTSSFDGLDRSKVVTGPASTGSSDRQITTYTYDNCGKVLTASNGLGETTVTTGDAIGRPVSINVNAGERITTIAYSADHHKTTTTVGNGAGAIVTEKWTDNGGLPLIDRQSNGKFTLSTYDNGGKPLSRRDEIGLVSSYTFDGLGRPKTEQTPDGALTTLIHDGAGNLTERQMPGNFTWKAIFDNAGRKTSEQLDSGASITRSFSFDYYPSGTWIGMLKKSTDPRTIQSTVTYDDFLRVNQEACTGTLPEHVLTRIFDYDRRGLLKQVIQNYGNQAIGPPSTVDRVFDAYGQITAETVTVEGRTVSSLGQKWNAARRRKELGDGGGHTLTYGHDATGALSGITDWNSNAYSFPRGNNGLLQSRTNPWRIQTATLRDHAGKLKTQTTTAGSATPLVETLNWRDDSKIDDYTATRNGGGAFSETRDFQYSDRGQLTSETYAPVSGQTATLSYGFDSAKRNIRVSAMVGSGGSSLWDTHANTVTSLARITEEASTAEPIVFLASGNAFGSASVDVSLDGTGLGRAIHTGWEGDGTWHKQLRLTPGSHTLVATAHHPSGQHNPTASHTFSANIAQQTVSTGHDDNGSVTTRTFSGGRVQTLTWDAADRLVKVIERDGTNHGYNWTAIYDGLGRRISTKKVDVANGVASSQALVLESTYDPEVEFLEIATRINGERTWKIHGPDLNGDFGGMQGIGGLEATIRENGNVTTAIISDIFGNAVATAGGGTVAWNTTRTSGYGALPNSTALSVNDGTAPAKAAGWRGKAIDPTGFYYLGARYYEPVGGRFLSADPAGHGASMSLYDYANGDPINQMDPDGRVARGVFNTYSAVSSAVREVSNYFGGNVTGLLQSTLPGTPSYSWTSTPSAQNVGMWHNTLSTLSTVAMPLAMVSGPVGWIGTAVGVGSSFAQGDLLSVGMFATSSIGRMASSAIRAETGIAAGISGGGRSFAGTASNAWGTAPKVATPTASLGSLNTGGTSTLNYSFTSSGKLLPVGTTPSAYGGVNFAKSPDLFPSKVGQSNIVKIEYSGTRSRDFGAANAAAGMGNTQKAPAGYTWHHLDDYDAMTNTGTMQLIRRGTHEATYPHMGGVSQYERATGVPYDLDDATRASMRAAGIPIP